MDRSHPTERNLREAIEGIQFTEPAITLVSALSGQIARKSDFSIDYWVRHIVEPVDFVAAIRALEALGVDGVITNDPRLFD